MKSIVRVADMDRDEAIKLLKSGPDGVRKWHQCWMQEERIPILGGTDLSRADLTRADLRGTNLSDADLRGTDLSDADLSGADLHGACLSDVYLRGADLRGASLSDADLRDADLRGATLSGAVLRYADLRGADLRGADLSEAVCGDTSFGNVDLSEVKGLESIRNVGPSTIGIDTLFSSKGKLPEAFLRGCGVHENLIVQQRALVGSLEPIQFYSCFISYSTKNQDFAERLHAKLRDKGLRVWFAPEDVQGGKKLHEQIDEAIRVHDKLLLVLSPQSMNSEWVKIEIRKARRAELTENRRKLFPIRLVEFNALRDWECIDSNSGQDLAEEVRQFFIPDFSNWKDQDSFEAGFSRLIRDLKAEESTGSKKE
jgi:hypothetical protein